MTTPSDMAQFIGTKQLRAQPMTRGEYNTYRGWELPANENEADEGYLVEYTDGGAANDSRHAGYISWSPRDVFERAYRPCAAMTFGLAIEALKQGKKVARAGWNGKGMWLVMVPGRDEVQFAEASPYRLAGLSSGEILPHIDMWTVNAHGRRAMLPGWLASQTDMLAEDWVLVE